MKTIKPTKLQYLQYRVLTRKLTTNIIRHKWNTHISEYCTFCQTEKETIRHLLVECPKVTVLWENLTKMFRCLLRISVNLDPMTIIVNNYKGPCMHMVNSAIIIMKQYIYACKCYEEQPIFVKYMGKLSYSYHIEKTHAFQTGKIEALNKKWSGIF